MPIEKQLLPDPALKPFYAKVTWLYVCRTFKSDQPRDVEALRTHDRFGVSSWPQMFLFDPIDDAVLADPPRDKAGFIKTFERVLQGWRGAAQEPGLGVAAALRRVHAQLEGGDRAEAVATLQQLAAQRDDFEGWLEARELLSGLGVRKRPAIAERLADPDPRERVIALEELRAQAAPPTAAVTAAVVALLGDGKGDKGDAEGDAKRAAKGDAKGDIVVRIRALQLLRHHAPAQIPPATAQLLALGNDPLRYEVLAWLREHPAPQQAAAQVARLLALLAHVGDTYPSRNPNVVRIRVVECLGQCGDASCVPPLLRLLREGSIYNGLTRQIPAALAGVAARLAPAARRDVALQLVASLPAAISPDRLPQATRDQRLALATARAIHAALGEIVAGRLPRLPSAWTEVDRDAWAQRLRDAIGRDGGVR